jgi:hypothetical protein
MKRRGSMLLKEVVTQPPSLKMFVSWNVSWQSIGFGAKKINYYKVIIKCGEILIINIFDKKMHLIKLCYGN